MMKTFRMKDYNIGKRTQLSLYQDLARWGLSIEVTNDYLDELNLLLSISCLVWSVEISCNTRK